MMRVRLSAANKPGAVARWATVQSYAEASRVVLAYIARNDLGAGCGERTPAFTGGEIIDEAATTLAQVSYNGRVWDNEGKEINL